jgi:hypothetical protein
MYTVLNLHITIIIALVTSKRALFETQPSLEDYGRYIYSWELDHPVFTSWDFAKISKAVKLACNPNLEDQVSVFVSSSDKVANYNPRHRVPFTSHSTTRRATGDIL